MKLLKAGIVVIVVVMALTLLTLRMTGLEPEYLDLDQLRAHHMIARPGLWLKGEVVTAPVTDWSFVDKVEHPGRSINTVLVETRPPYSIPPSGRTMPFVANGLSTILSPHALIAFPSPLEHPR